MGVFSGKGKGHGRPVQNVSHVVSRKEILFNAEKGLQMVEVTVGSVVLV